MKRKREAKFLGGLKKLPGLTCVWEVGRKRGSSKDNVDLLAGFEQGRFLDHRSEITSLFKEHYPGADLLTCDDGLRFTLPTWRGGIAICNTKSLLQQINGWICGKDLDGKHKPWATGYWLPEALCGDLVTAKCLHDADDTNNKIRRILLPYPPSLARSIQELCVSEIRQKAAMVEQLSAQGCSVELHLCMADISASLVRLSFARSMVYFRGFRALDVQAKKLGVNDLQLYKLAKELIKNRARFKRQLGQIEILL